VVQACNPPDTFWVLGGFFKLLGRRFVFDQHDLCPELYESRFGRRGWWYRALLLLERCTYRIADHVISTNESYRQIAVTRGGKDDCDVTVVRSCPDPDQMRPATGDVLLKRGRRHLCAYLGIMGPQDSVDVVVRAADVLVHQLGRRDCQFVLMGFGDCLDDLKMLAKELDVEDFVTFTGRAEGELISTCLSTADIGLSPDVYNPLNDVCTMNKTMEYMAFELPIVAFDLKETRVTAGNAAVYAAPDVVSFSTEIDRLLQDPLRRALMGSVGRRRIERELSWRRQVPAYVAVHEAQLGLEPAEVRLANVTALERPETRDANAAETAVG
jgi:glycosyltransferase involved in cell wall biosynthesis